MQEDSELEDVVYYTRVYPAVIKVARMLVASKVYLKPEDEMIARITSTKEQRQSKMDEDEARDEAQGTSFRIV
jgi:hypothetical protein